MSLTGSSTKRVTLTSLFIASQAFAGIPAPKPLIAALADLPVVVKAPYNQKADADAAVLKALQELPDAL